MTTGWSDAAWRADAARARTDQGFADALCGPDGTGDPSVMMPVLQVYSDALSAPMPDAMVAVPPVDPAAMLAAAGAAPTPAQARVAAQRMTADRVARAGRYGGQPAQSATARPPQRREPPLAWGSLEPHSAVAPHLQGPRQPGSNRQPTGSAPRSLGTPALYTGLSGPTLRTTLSELGNLARSGFPAVRPGAGAAGPRISSPQAHAPAAHAPTPPLPRNLRRRRNKGSSIWAVLVFLIVIAFASGIAQQIIGAISELFNR